VENVNIAKTGWKTFVAILRQQEKIVLVDMLSIWKLMISM